MKFLLQVFSITLALTAAHSAPAVTPVKPPVTPAPPERWEGIWPPVLPGAVKGTVTIATDAFLEVPAAVEKARTEEGAAPFVVAKTAPTVELAYHGELPDRALNGTGWTIWGDICVAGDGKVYMGIGNHGRNAERPANAGGNAFIYCWNPETKTLAKIADLNQLAGGGEGDPSWSKVHGGVLEDASGQIYFTGTLNAGGRSFQTAWTERVPGGQLFRHDPKSGESRIITVFPGEVTATTLLDRDRGLWYAIMEGKTAATDAALTVVDLKTAKVIYQSPHDAVTSSRNLALARTGAVFFNGRGGLWKFDPATRTISATHTVLPNELAMRSSTGESRAGFIYGTTMRPGVLFRYAPASDKLEPLGPEFLNGNYTTVTLLSPDEKYVYYLPGAHGGASLIGTPVVQYHIATGRRKVLAFLKDGIEKAANFSPAGTYGVKMSADGSTLYVNFNGNAINETNPPKRQAKGFGLTAFAAIHIPESERSGP
ncbi:MAG TPA: hypothetical protein VGO11_24675 [Chthoniobacteraceae bacterium]|jgi:hypothetical protein|nr:hypothetical protein [Chthoniobacteraceae bacterium]